MRSHTRAVAVALLLLPGCGDGTAPRAPEPGQLVVTLATPNDDDAGAVLTLLAPAGVTLDEIEAVTAGPDGPVLYHRTTGHTTRIAIIGPIRDGAIVRFSVPDLNRVGDYSVQLVEVAAETNALRESLTGYSAAVSRVP